LRATATLWAAVARKVLRPKGNQGLGTKADPNLLGNDASAATFEE